MSDEKALAPLEPPVDDTGLNRQDSHAETSSPAKSIIADKEETTQPVIDFPEGGRGWWVAAGSACILFSTFGYANTWGVFQEYYLSHQLSESSHSAISWIGSTQLFFLFSSTLIGGPLFDQYGTMFLPYAAVAFILSTMMTSLSTKYWHVMLAQGVLGGISMGMTMSNCMGATGHYFNKKRGAAMGLVIAGSSLGGVMFPIALGKLFYNKDVSFGWSIRICGFIQTALIGFGYLTVRPRLPRRKGQFFLPAAFKELLFGSIVLASFLMMFGIFLPFFYLPSYAVSQGMSPQLASYLVSILNAASFLGRVVPGVLGDKWGRLNMLFAAGLSTGILVFCFTLVNSNASIIVFAAVFGFCQGAIISSMSVSMSTCPKDQRNMGTYMGMGMATMAIAVLIGPPIDGAFLSKYNSFEEVSYFGGALTLVGTSVVLVAKYAAGKGMVSIS